MKTCNHCNESDFFETIPFATSRISNATGKMKPAAGPIFKNNKILDAEAVYTDICKTCGTIRMYVKEINREWCNETDVMFLHQIR